MDSRESLGAPPPPQSQQQQQHHSQPPPGMLMQPANSYPSHIPNTHNNNNTNSSTMINPNSTTNNLMQQNPRSNFPFNSDSLNSQYGGGGGGDGSSPVSGFRAGGFSIEPARKKRGRPRKYSPNPSPDGNIALGLAPSPISITPVGGGGGGGAQVVESNNDGTPMSSEPSTKKNRGRPPGSGKKQLDALGSPGVGFTPHVITVKAGEDIMQKIMSFTQQGPRTVCILSANGAICNVTLRQPAMSGGTVTYEGRFEIISLSGSFMPSESNGGRSRSGALSVSLAGSDGRVLGGGVAGMLTAATPVQVVVGSFIADGKKSKSGPTSSAPHTNMLNFGGSVPGVSPPSEGASSKSSDEGGSSPLHRLQGSYNNNASQPIQNMSMYSNMGWPNSTMNMLPN